ncbi:MAG: hypothetical protein JWP74_1925 [Marmoricola sp.]|nr:hypothetical protein [Marmoricola sp.]
MNVTRPALAAVALALALAGTIAIVAPSNAAPDRAAAKPKTGLCRNLTTAQGGPMTNDSPTVSCSSPHTTYTFAVPNLPKKVDAKHLSSSKFEVAGIDVCTPGYRKLLGGSWGAEDQTMFSFTFFTATKAQRAQGARWVRCDLILVDANQLTDLPTVHRPLLKGGTTDAVRRCYDQSGDYVPCTETHNLRSATFFTVHGKKYLSEKKFIKLGEKNCPKADRAYFGWPNKYSWALGDHAEVCYRNTTS